MAKRILIVTLGVFMVVAFHSSAMAAAKVDFSGTFRVRALYYNNPTMQGKEAWESKKSYLDQRLRVDVKIMPTENLTLNLGLTTEDQIWGQQGTNIFAMKPYGTGGAGVPAVGVAPTIPVSQRDPQTDFELRYFWLDIKSPIGLFSLGRKPMAGFSPRTFGWTGSRVMPSVPGGQMEDNVIDTISYALPLKSFVIGGSYVKKMELDSATGEGPLFATSGARATNTNGRQYDQDWDQWNIFTTYKFENGGVGIAFSWDQARGLYGGMGAVNFNNAPIPLWVLVPTQAMPYLDPNNNDIWGDMYTITIPGVFNFGPFGFHYQFQYAWGQMHWHLRPGAPAQVRGTDGTLMDVKDNIATWNLMFYADATYNYGPGLVGLQYIYYSGDKTNTDYVVSQGLYSVGGDFTPLLIAYDRGLTLGVDQRSTAADRLGGLTNIVRGSNHQSFIAWVDHSLTEDLMIHVALGYIDILEAGQNRFNKQSINKHYGTELDVSVLYNLMANLSYQLDIGYFWTGDYFKQGWGGEQDIRNSAAARAAGFDPSMAKVGNAWAVRNTLTLKF